jgi:hypothetical protein
MTHFTYLKNSATPITSIQESSPPYQNKSDNSNLVHGWIPLLITRVITRKIIICSNITKIIVSITMVSYAKIIAKSAWQVSKQYQTMIYMRKIMLKFHKTQTKIR